mmetsp:Transcript_105676/g.268502  ORF Transcript_105676/g.268502 Transcript_105676/m.268502 type:complete len:248 (+) Transcript_105676:112-855(+)
MVVQSSDWYAISRSSASSPVAFFPFRAAAALLTSDGGVRKKNEVRRVVAVSSPHPKNSAAAISATQSVATSSSRASTSSSPALPANRADLISSKSTSFRSLASRASEAFREEKNKYPMLKMIKLEASKGCQKKILSWSSGDMPKNASPEAARIPLLGPGLPKAAAAAGATGRAAVSATLATMTGAEPTIGAILQAAISAQPGSILLAATDTIILIITSADANSTKWATPLERQRLRPCHGQNNSMRT